MSNPASFEQQAATAFSKQSVVFDDIYAGNTIVHYKRSRTRSRVQSLLSPGSHILELNAGTGDDAIYFAQQGYRVHATDISEGMQERLRAKTAQAGLQPSISTGLCSFTDLDQLQQRGPYDAVFSNFAGLNCTDKLDKVIQSLPALLKPGGYAVLVILPEFCLWETLLALKGQFKTAFRRFFSKRGRRAHIEGVYFSCWYYNPSYVKRAAAPFFDTVSVEGLCTIVPPSYIEGFAEKYPRAYAWLRRKEEKLKNKWPWRSIGDYYIITLKKK
ncbi:MAG: class I SAM-dependent methyltransferase [Bacteroidetes bacterium]|nr:class I SAM-dependent methyltransferase [Bacteroidota bacterium]